MSNFKDIYKNQINSMCSDDISLTAEDILKAYETSERKSSAAQPNTISVTQPNTASSTLAVKAEINPEISKPSGKPARVTMLHHIKTATSAASVAIAAAIVILVTGIVGVSAGAMGYGPLATLFKDKLDDEVSATLIEEGYLLEVGTTQSSNGFDVTFEGITGETYQPMLLFTIRVEDEEFCKQNESFYLTVYPGFSHEAYDKCLKEEAGEEVEAPRYIYSYEKAVQDPENPNLYYCSVVGTSTHMINGDEFVVSVRSIRVGENIDNYSEEIFLDTKWELSLPAQNEGVLKEHWPEFYDSMADSERTVTSPNGVDFKLRYIIFSEYAMEVQFEYYFPENELSGGEENWDEVGMLFEKEFDLLLENAYFLVDGVEYKASDRYFTWCDSLGEIGPANQCYVVGLFPSIDSENAQHISIINGDQSIVIK